MRAEPNERTGDPDLLENTYAVASGAFGANYRIDPAVALASNVSVGFRAPSMFELYASGVHGGVAAFQQGTPRLDPERSISTDLSLRLRADRARGKVTVYRNQILNYIYLRNTGLERGDLPVFRSAQTDAVIRGIDAGGRFDLTDWLQLGGQASFITSTGEGINEGSDAALPLLPADRLESFVRLHGGEFGRLRRAHLRLDLVHTLEKEAAGRYEPFAQFDFGPPFGTASTEPYTLVSVEAGATVRVYDVPVSLHVTGENLFDTAYRDFLDTYKGYALSAGRNFGFKISVPVGRSK
jgi:iron complex outermembrane receptor protein/hemoglobin/transferrin/lactoferrin receptor protein